MLRILAYVVLFVMGFILAKSLEEIDDDGTD